jgi:hypothetical protein
MFLNYSCLPFAVLLVQDATVIVESDKEDQSGDVDFDMVVHFVNGDTLISDSSKMEGGLLGACKDFQNFVAASSA